MEFLEIHQFSKTAASLFDSGMANLAFPNTEEATRIRLQNDTKLNSLINLTNQNKNKIKTTLAKNNNIQS